MHLQKNPWPNTISELDREIPSSSHRKGSWQKERGTILTLSGRLENVFSGRLLGLVQKEAIAVFYTRMPRDAVRLCEKKWEMQEKLTKSKHPLQYRKWKNRLTWKAQTVSRPELKNPCLWLTRRKKPSCNYQHHPVCRNCKSGNRCICGIRCLYRHADGEK